MDEGASKEIIKSVNTKRKNWSLKQHIEFYARLGDEDYLTLEKYINSDLSKHLSTSTIHQVLSDKQSKANEIKKGKFKFYSLDKADKIFDYLKKIAMVHNGKLKVRVGHAIINLINNKGIDNNRIFSVLRNPEVYNAVNIMQEHNNMIEYIMSEYNKNLTTNYIEYYFDKRGRFQVIE